MDGARRISCACLAAAGILAELGAIDFVEARRLLRSASLAEWREWARRLVRLTAGAAAYWRQKTLSKGRRHLATGQAGASDAVAFGAP